MKINPLLLTVLCLAFTSIGFAQVVTPRRDVRDKPQGFDSTSYYRLTTQWQGDGKSLDVVNDGTNNQLILANTANQSGQLWKITKVETALAQPRFQLPLPTGPSVGYPIGGQPVNQPKPGPGAGAPGGQPQPGSGAGLPVEPTGDTIYEEVPDMPASDLAAVMNWIKVQVT